MNSPTTIHRLQPVLAGVIVAALLTAGHPAASAELAGRAAELSYFEGAWACEGKRFTPEGEQPLSASYDFVATAGGTWLETHYVEAATAENPTPLAIAEFWGHDAATGQFRNGWVNNFSMSGSFESAGWQVDDLTWATDAFPMPDGIHPMRATFRRSGRDSFNVEPAFDAGDGKWVPIAAFSCERKS
jgi:hypothetical protein